MKDAVKNSPPISLAIVSAEDRKCPSFRTIRQRGGRHAKGRETTRA